MDLQSVKINQTCPREELSLYLDGELLAADEVVLEKHLAGCEICRTEINLHKKMLSALDFAFASEKEVELPKNFAKVVASQAESTVSGLRSKDERFRALFICTGLFLLILVGLGTESNLVFSALITISGKIAAVLTLAFHTISDFAVGLAIVFRSLSQKVVVNPIFLLLLAGSLVILTALLFSRLRFRFSRS